MDKGEKRIRETTLRKLTNDLSRKYVRFLRAQILNKKEEIERTKNDLNFFITQIVQVSASLTDKYFNWYQKTEGNHDITADKIFIFFATVNGQSEAKKFRKKWEEKIWKEIRGPTNRRRAITEFNEKNVCILHLVISYIHQKIIKV